jgi:hypothetical protein
MRVVGVIRKSSGATYFIEAILVSYVLESSNFKVVDVYVEQIVQSQNKASKEAL